MDDLIYDWRGEDSPPRARVELNDETLRDGLQATYVRHPRLAEKVRFLESMESLGIDSANLGFPIAGQEQTKDIVALIRHAQANRFHLRLGCGGRILHPDVDAIIDVSQTTGAALEAGLFIASSSIRTLVEKWDLREMGRLVAAGVSTAARNGLSVMFVTEDITRAHPDTIRYLCAEALDSGAEKCVADTVGHATPWATDRLVTFVRREVIRNRARVALDWHGHNDRGLAVANSLAAARAGADRIQATALGVGERAGNASMVEILVNLALEGMTDKALDGACAFAQCAEEILGIPAPAHAPAVGKAVFQTATGVHAAAIRKALEMGQPGLAGIVYSAIDPARLGRRMEILIGPMSGRANAECVLSRLGIPVTAELVERLLETAKSERRILGDGDVLRVAHAFAQPVLGSQEPR